MARLARLLLFWLAMSCLIFFQASSGRWLFPGSGAPNVVLAAVLLIAVRLGVPAAMVTGFWGGLLVGALRGSTAIPSAAFYALVGCVMGLVRELRGKPRVGERLLLAMGLTIAATVFEGWAVDSWRAALASLAPQMLVQFCLQVADEIVPILF
jgi:hypothetical protein